MGTSIGLKINYNGVVGSKRLVVGIDYPGFVAFVLGVVNIAVFFFFFCASAELLA